MFSRITGPGPQSGDVADADAHALRLMLDSNVADAFFDDADLWAKVRALEAFGCIRLIKTLVQDAEHARARDPSLGARF